jgi:hypothetical protein
METTCREAGQRGGISTLRKHGRRHLSAAGKIGITVMRERHPGMAAEWGRRARRSRSKDSVTVNPALKKGVENEWEQIRESATAKVAWIKVLYFP